MMTTNSEKEKCHWEIGFKVSMPADDFKTVYGTEEEAMEALYDMMEENGIHSYVYKTALIYDSNKRNDND